MSLVPLDGRRAGAAAGLAALGLVASPAFGSTSRPLDLVSARLYQVGPDLVLKMRTAEPWQAADLDGGSFCLDLHTSRKFERVCVTGGRRLRLRYELLGADGRVWRARLLAEGTLRRHESHSLIAAFPFATIGLHPGPVGWRVFSTRAACPAPAEPTAPCKGNVPRTGLARFRIRRPHAVGCTRHGRPFLRHASGHRRAVALTFDDGPSPSSPAMLHVLHRFRVNATFFLLGRQVRRYPRLPRRELRAGNELGNHSFRHSASPSYRDLRTTNRLIRAASGFRPCLFRPPFGAVSRSLIESALALRMSTVGWDVDPRDWSTPGADAIARRVLRAVHPGAIVVMHDGGGSRSQTVAALPVILRGLHHRRYHVETVSQLLGDRFRWYPS